MVRAMLLEPDRALLLVIDVQQKLVPAIVRHEAVTARVVQLARAAALFRIPTIVTEQYPKGLGPTVKAVADATADAGAVVVDKPTFSACAHAPIRAQLQSLDRPQVIVAGIETHVCVQQTALDLHALDYDVFVCADAAGSRTLLDHDMALVRMRHEGVVVTTVESVMFELCGRCDTDVFKSMLPLIKTL